MADLRTGVLLGVILFVGVVFPDAVVILGGEPAQAAAGGVFVLVLPESAVVPAGGVAFADFVHLVQHGQGAVTIAAAGAKKRSCDRKPVVELPESS